MDKYTYLNNANGNFIDGLHERYLHDPQSIEKSWQRFFEGYEFAAQHPELGAHRDKEAHAMKLINAYRDRGHLIAAINPVRPRTKVKADLDLSHFKLSEADLDSEFEVGTQVKIGRKTLREIIAHLEETYCSSIGMEYRYIPDSRIRMWLHDHLEAPAYKPQFTNAEKKHILNKLAQAYGFEDFLHRKFIGQKRFSLEGCEAIIPSLDALIEYGETLGVKELVIGMAHRGRLNVLVNIFKKSYQKIFSEFEDVVMPEHNHGDGDVKYHKGHSADIVTATGQQVHLSLLPNPSHLEAVDPVVQGSVWAKGMEMFDGDFNKIVPVLIHGDAAIAGQGIVYEVANLSRLEGYSTGGTIHIIINNQVGFTANQRETRSSLYCTDIAKTFDCPVFHVNADDVEAVVHVTKLAIKMRQKFNIDVFIDLVGYRRYGHNEGDDPRFTQPLLYKSIETHPPALDSYTKKLTDEQVITADEAAQMKQDLQTKLQESLVNARGMNGNFEVNFLKRQWEGFHTATKRDFDVSVPTGIGLATLEKIAASLVTVPDGFNIYPKMKKLLDNRKAMFFDEKRVDWGMAELLAFGSLINENIPVRLSGQDSRRGTFAHRHAVWVDINDETKYNPLNHDVSKKARFYVYNSHLSEYGVLGFEYGYALSMPHALAIWEAQFGDFANGAQIIIDQFISSSESKWQRMNGIVMLLPHGYEGQGPEHSSARIGRYLDLCAENNIIVVYPTTPANMFHLLRRQLYAPYRKPLIVMTPKSLLRHEAVISSTMELAEGRFHEIIDDPLAVPKKVKRLLLCAGKIYYELIQKREELNARDVAIVRIEQFYPTPRIQDEKLMEKYATVPEWVWVQEEPSNMGAANFMIRRFHNRHNIHIISRPESASPATGSLSIHKNTQGKLIDKAFNPL